MRSISRGALLGALATVLIVVTPARGLTWMVEELGLGGLVLWVWGYSSVTEELFVRGWFQRFVALSDRPLALTGPFALSPRVIASGALFGSLHLSLLWKDADGWTVAIIVAATTTLGLFAALDRQRTGSLGPPIATHVAFNVGGLLGGIVSGIATFLWTGQPPVP